MRGQFHQNSFTIMTDRSTATSTKREICNGIRVDYQHILTRKECCEKNIKVRVVKFLNCEVVVAVVTIQEQNKVSQQNSHEIIILQFFTNYILFKIILQLLSKSFQEELNGQLPSVV